MLYDILSMNTEIQQTVYMTSSSTFSNTTLVDHCNSFHFHHENTIYPATHTDGRFSWLKNHFLYLVIRSYLLNV